MTRSTLSGSALLLLAAVCCLTASCSATSQEALHGRWYNHALSIRFRTDGSVVFNSERSGLATGRYFFDGEVRPMSGDVPVKNLTIDLAYGDRIARSEYEIQFLGEERIRITPMDDSPDGRPSDGLRTVIILKRSADDANAPLAAAQ